MRVGFVGLGTMGSGVVRLLLAAGHEVTGWNRSREKAEALTAEGLIVASSPGDAAAETDAVFTMLTNASALDAVAGEIAGALGDGAVWLDMSTIAPAESRALAARGWAPFRAEKGRRTR